MHKAFFCLLLVMFATTPVPCFAWNNVGHMTVAKIAYDGLDKETKGRIFELLQKHPHYEKFLKANKPPNVDVDEWVFLRAAAWPDWVRAPKGQAEMDFSIVRFDRPDDHFADLPVFAKGEAPAFIDAINRKEGPHGVVCALKQRSDEFTRKSVPPEDKAVALCWMLHLIGDIHQPLHCASFFSESRYPHGDFGGNAMTVEIDGHPWILHTYWDDLLGKTDDDYSDSEALAAKAHAVVIRKAASLEKAIPAKALPELRRKEFKDWAGESHALAEDVAYWRGAIAEVAVPTPRDKEETPKGIQRVPDGYAAKAKEVADRRAALAGYRAMKFLQETLKSK